MTLDEAYRVVSKRDRDTFLRIIFSPVAVFVYLLKIMLIIATVNAVREILEHIG